MVRRNALSRPVDMSHVERFFYLFDPVDGKRFTTCSPLQMETEGRMILHPGRHFYEVVSDLTRIYPEQSFCLVDLEKFQERIEVFRRYFLPDDPRATLAYAVKANPRRELLRFMIAQGIEAFDCASFGEISTIHDLHPKASIFFNHPVKKCTHIEAAARLQVSNFTVQTHAELEKVLETAGGILGQDFLEIMVRMRTNKGGASINLSSKYGAESSVVAELLELLGQRTRVRRGISFHVGSQNPDPEAFTAAIQQAREIADHVGGIDLLNVGGGIPVNYAPADTYELSKFLQTISRRITELFANILPSDAKIILEPGRALAAPATSLVIPIICSDTRDAQRVLYCADGVFGSFTDSAVHNWEYHFSLLRDGRMQPDCNLQQYRLFGMTCDCGDDLGFVNLPAGVQAGDHLVLKNAGAYMDAQGGGYKSGFCIQGTPGFNGFYGPTYVAYNVP